MPFQIANEIAAVKILGGGLDICFFITDEPKSLSASITVTYMLTCSDMSQQTFATKK